VFGGLIHQNTLALYHPGTYVACRARIDYQRESLKLSDQLQTRLARNSFQNLVLTLRALIDTSVAIRRNEKMKRFVQFASEGLLFADFPIKKWSGSGRG
jgi:hypothetical protein